MRIVAGKYRHRLIDYPDDAQHIRPTKDRIREAIFNALGNIDGLKVLDLYAGSGAMGIEALSRNAKKVTFVDINKISIDTINKNLQSLDVLKSNFSVLFLDDLTALTNFKIRNEKFNLIFLDPPYKDGKYNLIISLLKEGILDDKYIIVTESNYPLEIDSSIYNKKKDYKYGEIYVSIMWGQI